METVFTVVIPVHNREKIVGATLESLSRQGVMCPVVLVDNNSTDNSREVLTAWAEQESNRGRKVTIVSEQQAGAAAARNRGLKEVYTPWVMFFDSDDIMLDGHLQRVANAIKTNSEADIIGWEVAVEHLDGSKGTLAFADKDVMFRNMFNAIFATQRYVVRTEFFCKAGAWDETVMGWNDYETGMRLAAERPVVVKLHGTPTVLVVEQKQSITGTDYASGATKWEHALDCCEATLRRHGLARELRWLELRRMVLAALYARESSPEAHRLYEDVIEKCTSPLRRALLRIAFVYTRKGGRAIHLLLRPFI
jgi:glycosyltransferase involved in cell wall biosynthesis